MRFETGRTYLGNLPIPDDIEVFALRVPYEEPEFDEPPVSSEYIFNQICLRTPRLPALIKADIGIAAGYEQAGMNETDMEEFAHGVEAGYEFLIGNVVYTQFLRSGYTDFDAFLHSWSREFPIGTSEQHRIRQVRRGEAYVDPTRPVVESSKDLAAQDTRDYFFEAVGLETIFHLEVARITQAYTTGYHPEPSRNGPLQAHLAGFQHGINQAVEVFVQLQEESVARLYAASH